MAHIVYIITKLELGGAQKICLCLAKNLPVYGHGTVIISGNQGALKEQATSSCSTILLEDFTREIQLLQPWKEIITFVRLIKLLQSIKNKHSDLVIHTHSTKAGFLGRWAAFFAGCSVRIHTVHGYGFPEKGKALSRFIILFLEWITSFITTHYVCVSYKDLETGKKHFPFFANKSSVIRAAVPLKTFSIQKKNKESEIIIGSISCFKPQKNLVDLIKAFNLLITKAENKLVLEIIGDGAERERIEEIIHEYKLANNVRLLGWKNSVEKHMQSWSLFCLSSLWEGLPCAVVEACTANIPVVCYNVGGISEIISHGTNGFLVTPGNWQSLAHHMDLALKNSFCGTPMSVLEDFDENVMLKKHAALYSTLLQKTILHQ